MMAKEADDRSNSSCAARECGGSGEGRGGESTHSGEFKLRPSVVRSLPSAKCTMPGSVSAARMNVNRPIMPNWSVTMPGGMFVTRPAAKQRRPKPIIVCFLLKTIHFQEGPQSPRNYQRWFL